MILLYIFLFGYGSATSTGTLTVRVKNVQHIQGCIRMAVYNDEHSFPSETRSFQGAYLPLKPGIDTQLNCELPFGQYAIAVYHDLNNNGKMDKNTLGIPTEPYAFSNNVTVKWRAPRFREAAFGFNSKYQEITVVLKKWSQQE